MKQGQQILMIVAVIVGTFFVSLQLFLSLRISIDLKPSDTFSSVYHEYEETVIPQVGFETVQPISDHHERIETILPEKNDTFFNPVGIPLSNPKWYSLYRHYAKMKEKEAEENQQSLRKEVLRQFNPNLPYQRIETSFFDILFIKEGCVDLYKRSILIVDSNATVSTKTHLRSNVFTSPREILHVPGFEDYQMYVVQGAIPESVPSRIANLTWMLGTPQEMGEDECDQSFYQYIPIFYQSIYAILPHYVRNEVCS